MQKGKRWQTFFRICIISGLALIFASALPWGNAIAAKSHQDFPAEKPIADRRLFLQLVGYFEKVPELVATEMPPKDTTDPIPNPPTEAPTLPAPDLRSITAPEPGPPVTTWVLIIAVFVIIAIIVHQVISRRSRD